MKKGTIVLSVLLVLSNFLWLVFFAFTVIDHGVTMTYQHASYETKEKMLEQALVAANKNIVGQSLSAAEALIKIDSYGLEPFIKDGCFHAGGLCFKINENNIVTGIESE